LSYITKKGAGAIASALQEGNGNANKVMFSLKSGTSVKVRVPSAEDIVEVWIHSVFDCFTSAPCTRDDYYDKAVEILYNDANNAPEEEAKEIRKVAGLLRAKPRFLMGFINLETGEPIIIDFSKKQAQGVLNSIKKYEKRLDKLAFELSKTGKGQSTTVTLDVLVDLEEDLNDKQRKNFEESAGKQIPDEIYENCLYVKKPSEQLEDLRQFENKYKVKLLDRMDIDPAHLDAVTPIDVNEEDLPF
jgi:hypothetical protein